MQIAKTTSLTKDDYVSFKGNMSWDIESCVNYGWNQLDNIPEGKLLLTYLSLLLKQQTGDHFSNISDLKDIELIPTSIFLQSKFLLNEHQKPFHGKIPYKLHLSARKCHILVYAKNFTLKAACLYAREERDFNLSVTRPPSTQHHSQ